MENDSLKHIKNQKKTGEYEEYERQRQKEKEGGVTKKMEMLQIKSVIIYIYNTYI